MHKEFLRTDPHTSEHEFGNDHSKGMKSHDTFGEGRGHGSSKGKNSSDADPHRYGKDDKGADGLDKLVKIIKNDPGLKENIPQSEINEGAANAKKMNKIIHKAIKATDVADDGDFSAGDIRKLNDWIRNEGGYKDLWAKLHGDDEGDQETGFHLVQNDGATSRLYGENAVDTVADGIYHLGFGIENNRLLNEDGDQNVSLETVADWLDNLLIA